MCINYWPLTRTPISLDGVTVTVSCCAEAVATVAGGTETVVGKLLEAGCCGRGAGDTVALFRKCGTTYLPDDWEPADVGRWTALNAISSSPFSEFSKADRHAESDSRCISIASFCASASRFLYSAVSDFCRGVLHKITAKIQTSIHQNTRKKYTILYGFCMVQIHTTCYITPIMLHTKVDTQCDKLVMVVGRTKLTTLATVDMPRQNCSKFRVWDKVPEGSTLISGDIRSSL